MNKKLILSLAALALPLFSAEVMKISLKGSVSEEKVASMSKIVFSDTKMIAGSSYDLAEISKIEFYDDGGSSSIEDHSPKNSLQSGQIGITQVGSTLNVTILQDSKVVINLYSMSGRKISELANGTLSAGTSAIQIDHSIAAGIYSVVVNTNNALFVQKIVIK